MVIVFDLDDTLYDESTYFLGGLQAVANYLSTLFNEDSKVIYHELVAELSVEKNGIFDRFLKKRGIKNRQLISKCLSVYRKHDPKISLLPEALACLKRLKKYPMYVVTDGNKIVQKRKFLALGLAPLMRQCLCTYAHGIQKSKPSPYCFEKICKLENVSPSDVIYVADNPKKDFVGLKPLGFRTIRILYGPYKDLKVATSYDADITLNSLNELTESLMESYRGHCKNLDKKKKIN